MFFLAGLLVAGLAGLIIVPAFARRARRLAEARARLLAPLSVKEAIAERDLLRADHALAQHRLERRIAALQEAVGRHRADLGRQAAMLVALESGTSDRRNEISDMAVDFEAQRSKVLALEAELGASRIALSDFGAQLERASAEIGRLTDEKLAIETLTDEQRSSIAGLETRASGLQMKLEDSARAAKAEAAAAQAELARLAADLDSRRIDAARLTAELEQAHRKLERFEEGEAVGLERSADRLRVEAGKPSANGAAPGSVAEAANIHLEPPSLSLGDVALREAISRLGADFARLAAASGDSPAPLAGPGKSRRREARKLPGLGPEPSTGAAAAQVRQLRSMAPER